MRQLASGAAGCASAVRTSVRCALAVRMVAAAAHCSALVLTTIPLLSAFAADSNAASERRAVCIAAGSARAPIDRT